jgi:hypothetical protein
MILDEPSSFMRDQGIPQIFTYIGEGSESAEFVIDPEAVSFTVYGDGFYLTYY